MVWIDPCINESKTQVYQGCGSIGDTRACGKAPWYSYEIYSTSWWFSNTLCIQINLLTKWFILVLLERRRSCPIPKLWETGITWLESGITSSSQLLWDLFNFLVILHHFMYPNQAFHKVIHPGFIGTTKKLSYSQTGKLESPDLKVG